MKLPALLIFIVCSLPLNVYSQIAAGKCKFLGNVINNSVPPTFNTYWNQVTPENGGKWGVVESTRDVMNWTTLDLAFNHAKNNRFPFRLHTLIWGNQQPLWIASLPPAEQLEEIIEWFSLAGARYPGTGWPEDVPFFIDVVNEPINDPPNQGGDGGNYIQALLGPTGSGYDWIIKAFELARQYFPTAKLHINEYNVINNDSRTTEYLYIINLLKARNLIDGIGIQCHRFEIETAPSSQLTNNLNRLAETGLPIFITEFDAGNIGGTGTPDDNQQLEVYQRVFPLLWNHPAVHGITLWGYIEGQTWQSTAYLLRSNGTERPALTWLKGFVPTTQGGTFCLTTDLEKERLKFHVYPNPSSSGRFIVESQVNNLFITVYDVHGRILVHRLLSASNPTELHVSDHQGIYLMEIKEGNKTHYRKLLIR
ncbi:MAG: endo-1,4-beta-xylanase [Cyclobacteriaceae bacterium]|nr:endo-1,4-beta-xylanase [Cyclobacteriaceae bacterium]MCX7636574.1 endo-1,4-beta-xylanase [Cyclobacteriaceae bacterium]MDW8330588.1 endo-1,4-beta-xylanase [Cyclobacteriaceae bacterium]